MKKKMLKLLLIACLGIITTTVFTSSQNTIFPPDPPGIPIVIEMHRDHCTIKYRAPKNNGGAPILGYFIEQKKELDDKWTRINDEAINSLTYTINNLIEGTRIQFRVFALNAAGLSKPSAPCDPITVREH